MTREAILFLEWWRDRCRRDAVVDIAENKFTDQRWMDLAPAFVRETHILHHHGYNLAYWNLVQRRVETRDGRCYVDGEPLRFVHFSGVNPGDINQFSKHQNRFTTETIGDLHPVFEKYISMVRNNGWERTRDIPYTYGFFSNGRKISRYMRLSYRRYCEDISGDPFLTKGDIFDEPEPSLESCGPPHISRVKYELWHDRIDLRAVFDLTESTGRRKFIEWVSGSPDAGKNAGLDAISIGGGGAFYSYSGTQRQLSTLLPWPPQLPQSPPEDREEVVNWLASPVPLNIVVDASGPPIPRHLALLWEARSDLKDHFHCQSTEDLQNFLGWCLTNGALEGIVDLDVISSTIGRYVDFVTRPASVADAPATRLMTWMARVYSGYPSEFAAEFPHTNESVLTHIVWLLGGGTETYGWPKSFTANLRKWGSERAQPFIKSTVPVSNLLFALWRIRKDVRSDLDIAAHKDRLSFLSWVLNFGLREFALPPDSLSDELIEFFAQPIWRGVDGACQFHNILSIRRPDLLRLDIGSREGRKKLVDQVAEDKGDPWSPASLLAHIRTRAGTAPGKGNVTWLLRGLFRPVKTPEIEVHPALPVELKRDVLLTGLTKSVSGRGEDVRMTGAALESQGVSVHYLDRATDGAFAGTTEKVCGVNVVHLNAETALVDSYFLRRAGVSTLRTAGYWAWELSRFPDEWKHAFAFYDEIWASTRFAFDSISGASNKPVFLMPMLVKTPDIDLDLRRSYFDLPENSFIFFFSFDFNSFFHRKNPFAAISAFLAAFPDRTARVSLFIKTLGADRFPAEMTALAELAGADPRIIIRDRKYEARDLATLISLCDCFLSLHRSEGFGRGPAEAMLLGKPVIATAYSGNMDYMNEENSLPVRYKLIDVTEGQYPGWKNQVWADPDIEHAAGCMRRVAFDRSLANRLGEKGRDTITKMYGLDAAGLALMNRLENFGISRTKA